MTGDDDWLVRLPHRRYNPLSREWTLVSPQRTARPWQGETRDAVPDVRPAYDPACYLCPTNARAGGERNPPYTATYAFENDFAALIPGDGIGALDDGVLVARAERGRARVVCFSPRHDLSISRMTSAEIRRVVDTWADEYAALGALPYVDAVTIFENRGDAMGASNPHPHAQIWANETIPDLPARETRGQVAYAAANGGACLLCVYVAREEALGERIVAANAHVVALVPFWAVWPFETLVVPRRHVGALDALASEERDALADVMRRTTAAYDRVFDAPFPYSMGFHGRPTDGAVHPEWHLHAHYFPPLLRSASVRKYAVGYELLAMPQRDITPETAAHRLRACVRP